MVYHRLAYRNNVDATFSWYPVLVVVAYAFLVGADVMHCSLLYRGAYCALCMGLLLAQKRSFVMTHVWSLLAFLWLDIALESRNGLMFFGYVVALLSGVESLSAFSASALLGCRVMMVLFGWWCFFTGP